MGLEAGSCWSCSYWRCWLGSGPRSPAQGKFHAHHRQHHARAGALRLFASGRALVGRQPDGFISSGSRPAIPSTSRSIPGWSRAMAASPRKLSDEEAQDSRLQRRGVTTRDRKRTVYVRDGDLYSVRFLDRQGPSAHQDHGSRKKIRTSRRTKSVLRSPAAAISTLTIWTRRTHRADDRHQAVSGATSGALSRRPGQQPGVSCKKQEKELLAAVRDRARLKDADEAKKKRENPRKPFEAGRTADDTALGAVPQREMRASPWSRTVPRETRRTTFRTTSRNRATPRRSRAGPTSAIRRKRTRVAILDAGDRRSPSGPIPAWATAK